MANRNLITGLLNLDVLERDKARRLHLEHQLSVHAVCLALVRRTLYNWVEFFLVDKLINFETTTVAGVDSNLHAGFDIAGSGHNTSH